MQIPVIDRSNYLKGLLITARKDKQLTESEKEIIKEISEKLGFASDFYEETIKNLMANKYIDEDPIQFSENKIARSFIIDGLRLAFSDKKTSLHELDWLKKTASANGLSSEWFDSRVAECKKTAGTLIVNDFALLSII
jgi:hypothetical protein